MKSYNRKGFGFIMCQDLDVDVYFTRENLAPQFQHADLAGLSHALAGEYVTFDVFRFPDGKMQARNLRPVGECNLLTGVAGSKGPDGFGGGMKGGGKVTAHGLPIPMGGCFGARPPPPPPQQQPGMVGPGNVPMAPGMMMGPGGFVVEDRSLDWYCGSCSERNFTKRSECFKCKSPRPPPMMGFGGEVPVVKPQPPPPPRRTLSPHSGSRAMRDMMSGGAGGGGGRGARSPSRKRPRSSSSSSQKSSSSSESSSERKKKRRKKTKNGKKRKARSSSSSSNAGGAKASSSAQADIPSNPEIEKAKSEVLEKLMKIKQVEPKEQRIKDWRALLREWHPDKNPDRVEVATAVFQFLQKGKLLIGD